MKKNKKVLIIILSATFLCILGFVGYMASHYFLFDDYKKALVVYEYEPGTEYKSLIESSPGVQGMELVAESDSLKLYTHLETTEIAVFDKRSGEITYSNPQNRGDDPIASGVNKSVLGSQLLLSYYDSSLTIATMNNYDKSVSSGQYTYESIGDGIRYIYTFGDLSSETGIVPPFITEERLEELVLSKLAEKQAKVVKRSYTESKQLDGFLELLPGIKGSAIAIKKLNGNFEEAGYSQDDFDEEAALASGGEKTEKVTFTVPLEYRLIDDQLEVSVPTDQIVETGSAKLANIEVLKFFGAGQSDEEGYMLVPNGSGSIIHFNNGKKTEQYNQYVYGMDILSQSYVVVESIEKARLPIFGIKKENSGVLVQIKTGDPLCNIIADVSGKLNSYNYVYPKFTLRGADVTSMFGTSGASADVPVAENEFYKLNITISYAFMEKDQNSYAGMANYMRSELIQEGILTPIEKEKPLPFYVDLVGGVQKQMDIVGVPYWETYPMTTFEEAQEIVEELNEQGIENLKVNFLGWFNGGYYHDVADKVKINRKLGGKKKLENLSQQIASSGGSLYGDVALQKVSYNSKRYNYKMESSRYYAGVVVGLGRVDPVTFRQTSSIGGYRESLYNAISPKFLVRYVDHFSNKIKNVDITGVSLRDMADELHSDKKRTEIINREEAKNIVKSSFETLVETDKQLMVSGGDYYALEYVSDIINMPMGHNQYYIVDEEVPFYQMLIHGCVGYAGDSINLNGGSDATDTMLRLLEFGAAPHFTFSFQESGEIKYSGLNNMYATQYENWLLDAGAIYHEANAILSQVSNSFMVNHEIMMPGVRKVTYDNGVVIYINRNNAKKEVDGMVLPARSYSVKEVAL